MVMGYASGVGRKVLGMFGLFLVFTITPYSTPIETQHAPMEKLTSHVSFIM